MKILRFTASWCQPCNSLAKNLEEAKLNIPVEVIDLDVHNDLAIEYGIRSVPTLVLIDENIEVKRSIGTKTIEQLKEWAR